uniref:SAM-dependent MTase RsmB/NOP-type domain-containing protein n=1 Tax=Oryza nivara TaxID=4536 RepID=A0A0E0IY86_ORYNI
MPPPPPSKNRGHVPAARPPPGKPPGRRMASRDAAERAAFFARREAAAVLRRVLRGDASRRAAGSIKSLVYSPSVRNKRATFALVCQTLKYLPILKEVLASTGVLTSKWKKQEELVFVTAYDILFGQETAASGSVEQLIMLHKDTIMAALEKMCIRRKVRSVEDLVSKKRTVKPKPRFLRVNTLRTSTDSVVEELNKIHKVDKDELVPDLLVLPPGTDLHNHHLVSEGKVFLQGKASCMVAVALCPEPGWKVIDACAAPGNKTVHLAALMNGEGSITACELNKERTKTLQNTIRRSGANSNQDDASTSSRIRKLSAFQRKALSHALSFPSVERVVYSTCSIHQAENEDVVSSVLPLASSLGFELATPFPQWRRRGLPVFEGSEHLLRTDPEDGLEGFFISLFVRKAAAAADAVKPSNGGLGVSKQVFKRRNGLMAFGSSRLSRMMMLCSTRGLSRR